MAPCIGCAPPSLSLLNGDANGPATVSAVGKLIYGLAGTAAGAALTYHGYKRNGGSLGWGLAWGVFGGLIWPIALPIALGQGLGVRKRG